MKFGTYKELVRFMQSNELLSKLVDGSYYGDNMHELSQEAQNICFEFVLAMPGVRELLEAEFAMTGDDQMLLNWLRDDVLTVQAA